MRRTRRQHATVSTRRIIGAVSLVLFVMVGLTAAWLWQAKRPHHQITEVLISTEEPDADIGLVERATHRHLSEKLLFGLIDHYSTKVFSNDALELELLVLFPRFESIEVMVFEQQLLINAAHRRPQGLWCIEPDSGAEKCWFFDATMTVYSQAPLFSEGVYVKYSDRSDSTPPAIGEQILDDSTRQHLVRVLDIVSAHNLDPTRITLETTDTIRISIQELFGLDLLEEAHLLITKKQTPETIDERLALLLATPEFNAEVAAAPNEFAYADLRFPGRLVYKMNNDN